MVDRAKILTTAESLINGDRRDTYGPARKSFERIGKLWGIVLGTEAIAPEVVALMLAQLKVSRILSSTDHEDSWVDLAGYAALGGELATESTDGPLEALCPNCSRFVLVDTKGRLGEHRDGVHENFVRCDGSLTKATSPRPVDL